MSSDGITNLLSIVLMTMILILFVLVVVYFVLKARMDKPQKKEKGRKEETKEKCYFC